MIRYLLDIWQSFRALPLWVQLWIALILVPVNVLSSNFLFDPMGWLIGLLAFLGLAMNAVIMLVQRGFSKAMAIPHLIFWIPLLIVAYPLVGADVDYKYGAFIAIIFWVNLISILFDLRDAWQWWQGDRSVARRDRARNTAPAG
ncbi:hypothetical protein GCM10008927_19250 [Amylibacter ulvae]|uniref:Holin n=1 Tax=Paramylibacter ulvae TaxID=1651968 RepID=A0ABQ3D227_9RHOB|nr:hypothetical protein [Amylibacter ulvae]GHA53556.1 hypothetical protein GCM10008927_19250 [Amylibacter ulvae]